MIRYGPQSRSKSSSPDLDVIGASRILSLVEIDKMGSTQGGGELIIRSVRPKVMNLEAGRWVGMTEERMGTASRRIGLSNVNER